MASDTSGSNEGWRVDTVNHNLVPGHGRRVHRRQLRPPSATPTATPTVHPLLRQRLQQRHSYSYSYGYSHDDSYCYTNSYSYGYGQTNAYCEAQRNTEATSHTAAAPLRELAWRFWGAHASRVLVSASTPKRIFPSASQLTLNRADRRSPRWRGRHRQHAGRVRSPNSA